MKPARGALVLAGSGRDARPVKVEGDPLVVCPQRPQHPPDVDERRRRQALLVIDQSRYLAVLARHGARVWRGGGVHDERDDHGADLVCCAR
jgi:hypothetical protein